MDFEIAENILRIETIAVGSSIRDLKRLIRVYDNGRWRKLKGFATVRLMDGSFRKPEIHRYEAHGIGRKEFKLKLPFLD